MTRREDAAHPSDRVYVAVFGALVALTGVTVGVSYLDMKRLAMFAALLVATTKAGLVAAYFMHLRFEPKTYTWVLAIAVLSIVVFLGLTFADVGPRYR